MTTRILAKSLGKPAIKAASCHLTSSSPFWIGRPVGFLGQKTLHSSCSKSEIKRSLQQQIHSSANSPKSASAAAALHIVEATSTQVSGIETPSFHQLKALFVSSAIPMVGFGFMDNFIMIQAGGYIDATLGVKFGLATMTAAAMGQVVSDVR